MPDLIRIPNPMSAIVSLIKTGIGPSSGWIDPPVGNNVFSGQIPKEYVDSHKTLNCVLINSTGGMEDGSEAIRSQFRVDIFSYGSTFEIAGDIDLAIYSFLKNLRGYTVKFKDRRGEDQSLYVFAAIPGGPIQSRDPDTDWFCTIRPYRFRIGERNQLN